MEVKDYQDGKLIYLTKPFDSKSKILFIFYFLVFFVSGMVLLEQKIIFILEHPLEEYSVGKYVFEIAMALVLLIAAFRFANKALMGESIFVNNEELQLIKKGILQSYSISYNRLKISNFRHLDKPVLTKHPLEGETFDYTGWKGKQMVINEMQGDNRVAFDYENKTVSFGENVYIWQFEELMALIH